METKIRVGDVYLQADGWGLMVTRPTLGENTIVTSNFLNTFTLCPSSTYYLGMDKVKLKDTDVFLFNVCDLFSSAREAMKEHHENSSH